MALVEADRAAPVHFEIIGFARELYRRSSDDRILAISAGATFFTLLAVFPAVAAGVSLFGLVEDLNKAGHDLSRLSMLLPGGAISIIGEQIQRTIAKSDNTLGIAAIVGFVLSIWSANAGIKSLFDALNIVLNQKESRSFLVLNGTSLLFTLGGLIVVAIVAVLSVRSSSWLLLGSGYLIWGAAAAGIMALWAALTFAIALLYYFGPSKNDIPWRWITWGSATTAIVLVCLSAAFSWYAANFGSFDKTYGSLGAAIGFMMWIWLSIVVVLCGAEINEILDDRKPKRIKKASRLPRKCRS